MMGVLCKHALNRTQTLSEQITEAFCTKQATCKRLPRDRKLHSSAENQQKNIACTHLERFHIIPLCSFVHLDFCAASLTHKDVNECCCLQPFGCAERAVQPCCLVIQSNCIFVKRNKIKTAVVLKAATVILKKY